MEMESSISTHQKKIKAQMIFVAVMIVIIILLGSGLILVFNKEPATSGKTTTMIPILQEGGNGIQSYSDKIKNNKTYIIIVVLILVLVVMLFINASKNKNRQLTEEDINQYTQQVKEARQIAGLSDNSQPSESDILTEDSAIKIPGLTSVSGIVQRSPQAIIAPQSINYNGQEPSLDDFYKVSF